MKRGAGSQPRVPKGARIGVVAPGFAVRRTALREGVDWLRSAGFDVVVGPNVLGRHGYLAGSDDQRAADLGAMIRDRSVRAIWFARGGYGATRILDRVPWGRLRQDPKPLIGYSDLTALFAPAVDRAGVDCVYGPVVTELGDPRAWHASSLRAALSRRTYSLRFRRRDVIRSGSAVGRLFGGNLSVLTHLCGTAYQPRSRNRILLIEDIGEPVYRIDRMLTQLRQAGIFRGVKGIVVGSLITTRRRHFPPDRKLDEVLEDLLGGLGVPVVRDLPVGHVQNKHSLPLGRRAHLDADAGRLRIEA